MTNPRHPSGLSRRRALGLGTATAGALLGGTGRGAATGSPALPAVPGGLDATDPVELARAMVRQDTSNAGGGAVTLPYALLLRDLWRAAGVAGEVIPTPTPDNVHFVARVTGQGAKAPLLFMGHSDVVPPGPQQWSVNPFGGELRDGWLYGRGALDMKGTNAIFMSALLRHVRERAVFDRDIIFLSDCDEENGQYGVAWLADHHYDKIAAGVAITEGGWFLAQRDQRSPMLASLTCADRRGVSVALVADRFATHSSRPYPNQAAVLVGRALGRLDDFPRHVRPNALVRAYFAELATSTHDEHFASAIRAMLNAGDQSTRDRAGRMIVARSDYPWLHDALLRTTVSVMSASAGDYPSVIPSHAAAQLRIVFQPGGDNPREVIAALRRFLDGSGVSVDVLGEPGATEEQTLSRLEADLALPPSTTDTDVFRMWRDAVHETYPGAGAAATQFEARTSAGPLRARGVPVYGIYPHLIDNESLNRMHGTDERVGAAALRQGAEMIYRMLSAMRVR
ncbi:M20/M25/M40 family metallo-hydrolase [Amycolatopsis sp. NPDC059027]|uniref:M20/M25/M40 family metallo-hydrolase n=1 Tax=unclassified Amycolatopsis TaxID=2618356 RepID=UPI00366E33D7